MNTYYYLDSTNTRRGPVDGNRLPAEGATLKTLVWCVGMQEWTRAADVPELASLFQTYNSPAAEDTVPKSENPQAEVSQPMYAQYQQPVYGQPYQQAYQQPEPYRNMPPMPDSNLVWAILCTICCCLPFGIVSIIYATKVSGLYASGQYEAALKASSNAKKWAIWGAVTGIVLSLLYSLFYVFILGMAGVTSSSHIY